MSWAALSDHIAEARSYCMKNEMATATASQRPAYLHLGSRLTGTGTLIPHDNVCRFCGTVEEVCECGLYECQVCTEGPGRPW